MIGKREKRMIIGIPTLMNLTYPSQGQKKLPLKSLLRMMMMILKLTVILKTLVLTTWMEAEAVLMRKMIFKTELINREG